MYQKHRDTDDWKWKSDGDLASYKFHRLKEGTDVKKVAVVLSLSGAIHIDTLPADILKEAFIYEITLDGSSPNPGFLRQLRDLTSFKDVYQRAVRKIGAIHGRLDRLHLFPAVPAPIAIVCGRELMPKVDPILVIYDDDRRHRGFRKILEVNE